MSGPGHKDASGQGSSGQGSSSLGSSGQEAEARRKRLRRQVFGDVLPDTTADERDQGAPESGNDDWLRSNVPPHHG